MSEQAILKKLDHDKIKINGNNNLIKMDMFLSFLRVDVEKSEKHLGSVNGWTKYINKEHDLIINGGCLNGIEYLDSIKFGKRLANKYNDYVNPFYLEKIMTSSGIQFFIDYYRDDIVELIEAQNRRIDIIEKNLREAKKDKESMIKGYRYLENLANDS